MNAVLILSILITIIGSVFLLVNYIREEQTTNAMAAIFTGNFSGNEFGAAIEKLNDGDDSELHTIKIIAKKKNTNQDLANAALGNYYRESNKEKSAKYFLTGANLGSMACQFEMFCIYHSGIGVPKDEKKAFEILKLASDNLNPSTLASYQGICSTALGALFLKGLGTERNEEMAKKYFKKGCDMGDHVGCECLENFENIKNDPSFEPVYPKRGDIPF